MIDYLLGLICAWEWKDVEFWFVGEGILKKQIEKMQGKYPVRYFGYIENQEKLAEVYRQADIFILPASATYEELFGIVLIEAMASGLPVIAANSLGPSEIVDHGVNGYLIPKGNVKALGKAIKHLLENPELRKRMGKEGRKKALEKYDEAIVAKQWQQVMAETGFG